MKRNIALLIAFTMVITLFTGCSQPATPAETTPDNSPEIVDQPSDSPDVSPTQTDTVSKPEVNFAVISGPTGIGAVKLLSDNDAGLTKNQYNYSITADNTEITGKLVSGDLDIAALATNLALNLYNQTDEIQLLAINTLSVLYLVENGETIQDISDLRGKTIHAMGQGANPEYILRHLLTENGIDPDNDVTIEFSAPDAIQAGLVSGEIEVGLLAMPAAMGAVLRADNARLALNMGDVWEDTVPSSQLAMGCIAVRKTFAEENPQVVADFLEEYSASVDYVNEHVETASELVALYGITPNAAIAAASIPLCNLVCITGSDAMFTVKDYYEILYSFNPNSIGGFTPDDGFYYGV